MANSLWAMGLLSAYFFSPCPCPGEQQAGNHLVFPVKTDLHRVILSSLGGDPTEVRATVIINGSTILKGSMIDASAIDLEGIRKQLAPYADREKGSVYIDIRLGRESVGYDRKSSDMLRWALEGFGRNTGFRTARVSQSAYIEWDETIRSINEKSNHAEGDEPGFGDDRVKVYAVRTILSRYLASNADCVVDIFVPLEKEAQFANDPGLPDSIRNNLQQVNLAHRDRIQFRVRSMKASKEVTDHFVEVEAQQLAESLGFKEKIVSNVLK